MRFSITSLSVGLSDVNYRYRTEGKIVVSGLLLELHWSGNRLLGHYRIESSC